LSSGYKLFYIQCSIIDILNDLLNLRPVIPIVVLSSVLEIVWGHSPDISEIWKLFGIHMYVLQYIGLCGSYVSVSRFTCIYVSCGTHSCHVAKVNIAYLQHLVITLPNNIDSFTYDIHMSAILLQTTALDTKEVHFRLLWNECWNCLLTCLYNSCI
jgi:hypothetical protein